MRCNVPGCKEGFVSFRGFYSKTRTRLKSPISLKLRTIAFATGQDVTDIKRPPFLRNQMNYGVWFHRNRNSTSCCFTDIASLMDASECLTIKDTVSAKFAENIVTRSLWKTLHDRRVEPQTTPSHHAAHPYTTPPLLGDRRFRPTSARPCTQTEG